MIIRNHYRPAYQTATIPSDEQFGRLMNALLRSWHSAVMRRLLRIWNTLPLSLAQCRALFIFPSGGSHNTSYPYRLPQT